MNWTHGDRMHQPPQRDSLTPNAHLKKKPQDYIKDFNQICTILGYFERKRSHLHRLPSRP
ncbi:MAG: hypothetical protein AAGD07_13185 [Planctomycetota bacterium]